MVEGQLRRPGLFSERRGGGLAPRGFAPRGFFLRCCAGRRGGSDSGADADGAGLRRANPAYARARTVTSGLQTAIALALTLDMGRRWALTQLVVPPGLIAAASATAAMLYGGRLAGALGI